MPKSKSKDNNKPHKRIGYKGENVRVSRTGGISATRIFKGDGVGATINTNHGVRLHKRLFKGARMGLQNGNFQFIGRYQSSPFNFNVSKNGFSTSLKHKRGSYNTPYHPTSLNFIHSFSSSYKYITLFVLYVLHTCVR
ncbi:MAG: Uncharacterised protein [Polaribacter sp. SA4-10]|nr:MAG: Uncharacterised protein [Polaribacter sp. SA4-10]